MQKLTRYQCDESRPACLLCKSAERSCSFLGEIPSAGRLAQVASPPGEPATPDTPAASSISGPPTNLTQSSQGVLNMLHLELLLHAKTAMFSASCFGSQSPIYKMQYEVVMDHSTQYPYLMHQILAFSALHLSVLVPHQAAFYRQQASELQGVALTMFDVSENSAATCPPRFLFAAIVGMHVLIETLMYQPPDFSLFLDKFVSYLRIARGSSVQIGEHWKALTESNLASILTRGQLIPDERTAVARETDDIQHLLDSSDLGPTTLAIYQNALNQLKALFQLHNDHPTDADEFAGLIIAFPVRVSIDYVELIVQRRPEALAILALFAALLHRHRHMWIIGEGGKYIIESISAYLGQYWQPWLAWPKAYIQTN